MGVDTLLWRGVISGPPGWTLLQLRQLPCGRGGVEGAPFGCGQLSLRRGSTVQGLPVRKSGFSRALPRTEWETLATPLTPLGFCLPSWTTAGLGAWQWTRRGVFRTVESRPLVLFPRRRDEFGRLGAGRRQEAGGGAGSCESAQAGPDWPSIIPTSSRSDSGARPSTSPELMMFSKWTLKSAHFPPPQHRSPRFSSGGCSRFLFPERASRHCAQLALPRRRVDLGTRQTSTFVELRSRGSEGHRETSD